MDARRSAQGNLHAHVHVCVIDGVFEPDPQGGVGFYTVDEMDTNDAEAVQDRPAATSCGPSCGAGYWIRRIAGTWNNETTAAGSPWTRWYTAKRTTGRGGLERLLRRRAISACRPQS
jgi:hypothetical protein